MSRQFRSDDTNKWKEGFGSGKNGDVTLSNSNLANVSNTSGSAGAYTCTNQWNWSLNSDWVCILHQTRGSGAGNWEINKVVSGSGGTITLKYPLQNNYVTSGASVAQLIIFPQYKNITVNSTVAPPSWNGSYGGIAFLFAKETINITGSINVSGVAGSTKYNSEQAGGGYYGGRAKAPTGGNVGGQAYCGEGYPSAPAPYNPANGNGGGGAYITNNGNSNASGGGGGNGSAGGAGGQSGVTTGGAGGGTAGNAGLTNMIFGGGGGGGGTDGGAECGAGASGGGIVILIAKNITISGSVVVNGANGQNAYTGGGGSAGGSVLLKSMTATLGTNKITANGGSGGTGAYNNGGAGGVGRIHIDYATSYSGSTSPSIDVRQDTTIKPAVGLRPIMIF